VSIGDKSGDLGWTLACFSGSKISPQRISRTFFIYWSRRNLAVLGVWPIDTYSPEFRELTPMWSGVKDYRSYFGSPVIPCGDMHQSFTDALAKWFFDNFPMFADSLSVLSVHCVARGLGASILYKCPASRGAWFSCDSTIFLSLRVDIRGWDQANAVMCSQGNLGFSC